MITMMSLLKRRDDLGFEEFHAWYTDHAEAATRIPGLRHYYVNASTTPDQEWDAVSMLTFDDQDAITAAMDSTEGLRSRKDTLAHVSRRQVLFLNRTQIEIPQ